MKVLSLFDGMACGMLAMMAAGVDVERYVAYEIDKYAVQTSTHNFPFIEHRGDVFKADFTEFADFDYLVGGSPCTYWSIAQKNNRETEASGMGWELFSQYVRALWEAHPRFFIYENNKSMSNAIKDSITKTFGFEPVCINSALVSAQNRQRLYWVGKRNSRGGYDRVNVEQPLDRGILLRDILDGFCEPIGTTSDGKSFCMTAGYANGSGEKIGNYAAHTLTKGCKSMVIEPVASTVLNINPSGKGINGAVSRIDAKSRCLTTNKGEGMKIIVPVCMRYERSDEAKRVRKQYEAGEIHHGFHELSELHPRQDGKTNTLSTVLKDNPICEPVRIGTYPNNAKNPNHDSQQYRIYDIDAKSVTLCGNGGGMGAKTGLYAIPIEFDGEIPIRAKSGADGKTYIVYTVKDGMITIKEREYPIKLPDGYYIIRKLTVNECKRLQTVPEWFEFPVSDAQAYKMLGNGWTVGVIAHLINSIRSDWLDSLLV